MFRPVERYADIASVAASGIGTADLPVAGTYYAIWLHCLDGGAPVSVANIIADILNVKLTLDGTTMYEANAAAIYDLWVQKYGKWGAAADPGMLPIVLCPDYFDLSREAAYLAWGMQNIKSFQLELTFGASVGTASHIDQVRVFVERSPVNVPLGEHYRLLKFARNFPSSGIQEVTELPTEGGAGVATLAWHWQYDGSAAVINNVEAIVNNQVVFNAPPLVMKTEMIKSGWQQMVSGAANDLFTVPFSLSNDPLGFLPHASLNDLRFRLDWSAAPNAHTLFRESMHGIGNANR